MFVVMHLALDVNVQVPAMNWQGRIVSRRMVLWRSSPHVLKQRTPSVVHLFRFEDGGNVYSLLRSVAMGILDAEENFSVHTDRANHKD